ncbi:MAG: phosphatase domain-containing protein, partial [Polyangiales bacterium]
CYGQSVAPDLSERRDQIVYRWDLDKTYLRTEFDTLRDLVRTAFEPAARKRAYPGASTLLREIRATDPTAIFILSGSPEQMRNVLEAKLRLDGIRWDGFTLKPSLRNLVRGRFRFLRDQLSYKLTALLRSRTNVPPESDEILFGDDAEGDAFIYSLYADIAAGRVSQELLMKIAEEADVYPVDIPEIVRIAARVPRFDAVRRIFIHLERGSSTAGFGDFGRRVCPFYNYFQPALVLLEDGALDARAVLRVGADLVVAHTFNPEVLVASFDDLRRRHYLSKDVVNRISEISDTIEPSTFGQASAPLRLLVGAMESARADLPSEVEVDLVKADYLTLFARDRARAKAAKRRALWTRETP